MNTLELLDRLVAFPTVSRDPNRALIDFVRDFLADRGIASEVVDAEGGRKANLFATVGTASGAGVLLSGHTDVVPVDDQVWSGDPFRLRLEAGRAYGRGATDMKGFVASALTLADLASRRRLSVPLHLAFSHDEEIGCVGVHSLLDVLVARGVRPRLAIVGEPTGMRVVTGHKGKIAARAVCRGLAGHSSMPLQGLNAIHLACDFVAVLRAEQDGLVERGARDDGYEVPYTTIHVGRIGGGTVLNVVPSLCTVEFEIRHVAADDAKAILGRIAEAGEAVAAANRDRFPDARITVEPFNTYPGLSTPPESEAVAFLHDLVGPGPTGKVTFGTEGGLFAARLAVPTVICGPGSMEQGHTADEFITLDQLAACDAMMGRLLDRLAA